MGKAIYDARSRSSSTGMTDRTRLRSVTRKNAMKIFIEAKSGIVTRVRVTGNTPVTVFVIEEDSETDNIRKAKNNLLRREADDENARAVYP
jgi:hypothetical protein